MLGLPGLVAQHNRRGREPDPSKKKQKGERERERGGLKGKNELGPCFVPKFSLQLRKC